MNNPTTSMLHELRKKYSSAPHSFLLITNLRSEAKRFMGGEENAPQFEYSRYYTPDYQKERLEKLTEDLAKYRDDEASEQFLQKRIKETELVIAMIASQSDPSVLNVIKERNEHLYEVPSKKLFRECLAYLEQRSYATDTNQQFNELLGSIHLTPSFKLPFSPLAHDFEKAKHDFHDAFPRFNSITASIDDSKLTQSFILQMLDNALADIGAKDQDWSVKSIGYGGNVMVSAYKKQVIVGKYFRPRSSLRFKQVVAHEIYCHVKRLMQSQNCEKPLASDEEGIAIVCEQIIAKNFSYKRMLRYLAVSLAWGVDNQHGRSFTEVHEFLWRAFMIINGCAEHVAKERAFYETARAFRGSNCSGGTVMTKDVIYFISNLRVWQYMSDDPNEYSLKKLLMV